MREIKFRAWDTENKKMYTVDELHNLWEIGTPVAVYQHSIKPDVLLRIDNNPLMQYTGLKDKNGKEIYEGDIVKETYNKKELRISEVGFKNGSFVLLTPNQFIEIGNLKNDIEVIGNIYENPDLLTPHKE